MQQSRERDPGGYVLSRTPLVPHQPPASPDNPPTSPGFNKKNNNNNNTNSINNNDLGGSPGAPSPQAMGEDGAAGGGVLLHTWHPHVFAKPPRTPTPHRIADILGWRAAPAAPILVTPKPIRPIATLPSPSASPLLVVPRVILQDAGGVHVADEPLNLTTRSRDASPTSSVTPPPGGMPVVSSRTFRDSQALNGVLNGALANAVLRVPPQPLRDAASAVAAAAVAAVAKRRKKDCFPNSGSGISVAPASIDTPLVASSNDAAGDTDGSGGASDRKRKKARTTFTGRQIFELEKQFELKKYLSTSERAEMARLLGVTDQQVKIWFQNRRTKWKKHDNISNAEAAEHKAQQAPQVPVRKELGAKTAPVPSNRLKPPTGSPSSGDEHSNGSMLTGDGSVSESCFSEPDASRSVPPPPVATSPSTASLSPVVPSAIPLEVRTPSSPHMPADTPSSFPGNTPTLGATAATPPSIPTPTEPSSPPPPLQVPPPPRPAGGATSQIQDEESRSSEATGLEQQRLTLSPS